MLMIQNDYQCHNLNLVSPPTHFVPSILQGLLYAVKRGFRLPLVYNCGGYESSATLRLLDGGVVDIYMPDYKYSCAERSDAYSKARDYPQAAAEALMEMDRQVGGLKTDHRGRAVRGGLLIRHLMLPGGAWTIPKACCSLSKTISLRTAW